MERRVILITGTPCVGKTTVARKLTKRLNAQYVNLTKLAIERNLVIGNDKQRHTTIIDEQKMKTKLSNIIDNTEKNDIIIDGHYAAAVAPKQKVTHVFVLRRNPLQLREVMEKRGFRDQKLWENLASEILDVCLVEALREQESEKVCELDMTDKSADDIIQDVLDVLENSRKCHFGGIDWLGMLDKEGKLDEYLKE
jgi:adenylate kinase